MKHNNKGFSLVELIVVIAIMAILGGVGTAGYSKYIENTNKKADMTLVGNVVRAIETGVYSRAYPLDEKMQPGTEGVQIPIGFVVLSEDGAEIVETSSEIVTSPAAKCSAANVTVYEVKKQVTSNKYYLVSSNINYCKTHSNIPENASEHKKTTVSELKTALSCSTIYKNQACIDLPKYKYNDNESFLMKGTYRLLIYNTEKHNSSIEHGDVTEYVVGQSTIDNSESVLIKMLTDAFGSNYKEQTKLAYTWNAGTVNSFFTNGKVLWNKVESLGDTLLNNIDNEGKLTIWGLPTGQQFTTRGYSSNDELAVEIGKKFSTGFTDANDFYVRAWKPVDDSDGDDSVKQDGSDSFYCDSWGFCVEGREFYCTARVAYNEAFANYLRDYDTHNTSHVTNVQNYGDSIGTATFPKTVCLSAFEQDNLNDNCESCKEIYGKYVSSGTSKLNAIEFYNTMATIYETQNDASSSPLGVMGYYGNYIEELQSVYSGVSTLVGEKDSVIVIAAYYSNDKVECEVLPVEANPRNK